MKGQEETPLNSILRFPTATIMQRNDYVAARRTVAHRRDCAVHLMFIGALTICAKTLLKIGEPWMVVCLAIIVACALIAAIYFQFKVVEFERTIGVLDDFLN